MIPQLIDIGGCWKVLPPGIHDATMSEIKDRYATNDTRQALFDGFKQAVAALKKAGCKTVFLDGSFVTEKVIPGDFDVCWDPAGIVKDDLYPVFLDFADKRKRQKQKYRGEFFPSNFIADGVLTFLQYFQEDKDTGGKKGIIRVPL